MIDGIALNPGDSRVIRAHLALAHAVFQIQIDQVQHDFGILRIKLRPHALDQLFTHLLLRNRLAVAALGGHGIIGIRNGDDTCDIGNIFPLQPVGIASPVIAFVMVVCPDAQIRGLLDTGENPVAVNRVELDLVKLFVGQFAVLVDDRVRDTDLPYVVEQPRKVYLFAVLLGFARLPGNLRGVHGHTGRVTVGVFVFGVDGRRKRLCRLLEQVMHVLLFFSVAFNLLLPAALQFAAHVLQGKNVQKRRGRNNGHILQGNAVHKHLAHGGNDRKAGEQQQRNAHVAAQPVEILKND